MVKKVVNIEVKANLQLLSGTREIDSRCPRSYRPSVKKDKDDVNWEYRDETPKNKAKSHNSSSANQPQTQTLKKNKHRSRWEGYLATKVNATEVMKKNTDKAKDLSQIQCYTCK